MHERRRKHDDVHHPMQGRGKRAPRGTNGSSALVLDSVKVTDACGVHPEGGTHECLADEMRCAYCGVRLAPYPCHGCGKFLTAKHMHEAAEGESWRCEECRGF